VALRIRPAAIPMLPIFRTTDRDHPTAPKTQPPPHNWGTPAPPEFKCFQFSRRGPRLLCLFAPVQQRIGFIWLECRDFGVMFETKIWPPAANIEIGLHAFVPPAGRFATFVRLIMATSCSASYVPFSL
jgi:hypothetical protein